MCADHNNTSCAHGHRLDGTDGVQIVSPLTRWVHLQARGLSGGQRSRVAMAAVSFARPHVLVLDEPTNNLDLEAVAALVGKISFF